MTWWTTGEIARAARQKAEEAMAAIVQMNLRLDNIMSEWRRSSDDVKAELRREGDRRDTDQKEWRESLGKRLDKQDVILAQRLDKQDRLMWVAVGVLITTLLAVIAYLFKTWASHGFQT